MTGPDLPDLERLRRKLALEHGVVVGRDDPVMALVAGNAELLRHYAEIIAKGTEAAQIHAAAGMAATTEEVFKRAEHTAARVVGAAADLAVESIDQAGARAAQQVEEVIAAGIRRLQDTGDRVAHEARLARAAGRWLLLAVGLAVSLVVGLALGRLV